MIPRLFVVQSEEKEYYAPFQCFGNVLRDMTTELLLWTKRILGKPKSPSSAVWARSPELTKYGLKRSN